MKLNDIKKENPFNEPIDRVRSEDHPQHYKNVLLLTAIEPIYIKNNAYSLRVCTDCYLQIDQPNDCEF